MTDLTLLDIVTTVLFFLMGFGLWWWILEWLNFSDFMRNRANQCPPHDWHPVYTDLIGEEGKIHKFAGLRCGKCKRTPGGRSNGESWSSGPLTPP